MLSRHNNDKFKFFTGWGYHFFYLLKNGELWGGGKGDDGQLSLGSNDQLIEHYKPVKIPMFSRPTREIHDIATGNRHTIFQTVKNEVMTSGMNSDGQLSLKSWDNVHVAKEVILDEDDYGVIVAMSSGQFATYYLTDRGIVFAAGFNTSGELCLGHSDNMNVAMRIKDLKEKTKEVIGGQYCVLFISVLGNIFMGGSNSCGQQCKGDNGNALVPHEITFFKDRGIKCRGIQLIEDTVFFLTKKNEVYVCGDNTYWQHGDGKNVSTNELLKPSETMTDVDFLAGRAEYRIFYRTRRNPKKIMGVGYNIRGSLGIGDNGITHTEKPFELSCLRDKDIVQVSCCYKATYFICRDGSVYACGANNHGQLLDKEEDASIPTVEPTMLKNLDMQMWPAPTEELKEEKLLLIMEKIPLLELFAKN